jgi:hypothetical protein
VFCDLFWSTVVLITEPNGRQHFKKQIEPDYFLAQPADFLDDHLPSDPVFQFTSQPLSIKGFTNTYEGIDRTIARMPYLNFEDSLKALFRMSPADRAVRIARHAYQFNKDNPNDLITVCFNHAVDVVNDRKATREQLKKARSWFVTAISLTDLSDNPEIRALKENCRLGLSSVNKRLLNSP